MRSSTNNSLYHSILCTAQGPSALQQRLHVQSWDISRFCVFYCYRGAADVYCTLFKQFVFHSCLRRRESGPPVVSLPMLLWPLFPNVLSVALRFRVVDTGAIAGETPSSAVLCSAPEGVI